MADDSTNPDRFFRPNPDRAAADVLGALDEIAAPSSPARSHGAVTSPEFRDPETFSGVAREGLWSTRIFGPLRNWRCDCGALKSRADAGNRCPRCDTECVSSDERGRRWAHVAVQGGVLHPALAPLVGAALGLPPDDVVAVARNEGWIEGDRVVRPASADVNEATMEVAGHAEQTGARA
jgi:hypothetical protein